MIYLAQSKKFKETLRIYVYKTVEGWNARLRNGRLIYLDEPKANVEDLLHDLIKEFGTLTLSKRLVDYNGQHIVRCMDEYCIMDNSGNKLSIPGLHCTSSKYRLEFDSDGQIKQTQPTIGPSGPLPEYYDNAKPIFEEDSRLWFAKDIDTGLWVCFAAENPEEIISQGDNKHLVVCDALSKHFAS